MKLMLKPLLAIMTFSLIAGCASAPDRFYTLNTSQPVSAAERPAVTIHVLLDVTVPSIVDRSEIVLQGTGDDVIVLQHERWAAPFVDQVTQTLGRNIEYRRPEVIVADRRFEAAGTVEIKAQVDVVQLIVKRGERVLLDAHWRVTDVRGGSDTLGSEHFSIHPDDASYNALARAISVCLAELGNRIAEALPRPR